MKGFPKLTYKSILTRHKKKLQDKSLHEIIEAKGIKRGIFNKLVEQGAKQKPFDKKKNT